MYSATYHITSESSYEELIATQICITEHASMLISYCKNDQERIRSFGIFMNDYSYIKEVKMDDKRASYLQVLVRTINEQESYLEKLKQKYNKDTSEQTEITRKEDNKTNLDNVACPRLTLCEEQTVEEVSSPPTL